MGCGCKNNGDSAPPTPQQVQQAQIQKQKTNESVKSAIKKTIEKYYNNDKKTNGWVR